MRDRLLRKALRDRFLVTLKTGETFDGLLDDQDSGHVTFVNAHAHVEQGKPVAVQGELWVDRANIAYLQRLPRGEA